MENCSKWGETKGIFPVLGCHLMWHEYLLVDFMQKGDVKLGVISCLIVLIKFVFMPENLLFIFIPD